MIYESCGKVRYMSQAFARAGYFCMIICFGRSTLSLLTRYKRGDFIETTSKNSSVGGEDVT